MLPSSAEEVAMSLVLSDSERAALIDAAARERQVRRWRRYQAVLLVADGQRPEVAAANVGCGRASVYGWLAAWRDEGLVGLREAAHPPPTPAHTAPLEALLTTLLADDPQRHGHHATGWTVSLLHGEAQAAGIAISEHTVRRAVRRLGWRWKRPKYVLGRPDPAYDEKKGRS
jgi:transposase